MKTLLVTVLLGCSFALRALAAPESIIWINVSVKMILHPDDGGRPRSNPSLVSTRITDAEIQTALDDANDFLATYQRGYRIRIVETLDIGGENQRHSNSARTEPGYYSIQASTAAPLTFLYPTGYTDCGGTPRTSGPLIDVLDQNARSTAATKTAFKWNDNAVNMFVPSGWGGGGGIFPACGNAAGFGYFEGWLFLHELGHYYDLYHTFDNDAVSDTLVDPATASQDAIAQELYGKSYGECTAAQRTAVNTTYYLRARNSIAAANNTPPNDVLSSSTYSSLPAGEQQLVDNVFFNLMSYYDPYRRNQFVTRLTEGQLDRMTDTMNNQRLATVSGRTWFVQQGAPLSFTGSSTAPFGSLNSGVNFAAASGSDIVLLRPGNYTATRISKPLTIRATRQGPATIRTP